MLIGELADAGGVHSQTLRFYERKGLLPQPGRGANGYRVYDESTLTRLHFIKVAQGAGLTLAQIRSIGPCETAPAILPANTNGYPPPVASPKVVHPYVSWEKQDNC